MVLSLSSDACIGPALERNSAVDLFKMPKQKFGPLFFLIRPGMLSHLFRKFDQPEGELRLKGKQMQRRRISIDITARPERRGFFHFLRSPVKFAPMIKLSEIGCGVRAGKPFIPLVQDVIQLQVPLNGPPPKQFQSLALTSCCLNCPVP